MSDFLHYRYNITEFVQFWIAMDHNCEIKYTSQYPRYDELTISLENCPNDNGKEKLKKVGGIQKGRPQNFGILFPPPPLRPQNFTYDSLQVKINTCICIC